MDVPKPLIVGLGVCRRILLGLRIPSAQPPTECVQCSQGVRGPPQEVPLLPMLQNAMQQHCPGPHGAVHGCASCLDLYCCSIPHCSARQAQPLRLGLYIATGTGRGACQWGPGPLTDPQTYASGEQRLCPRSGANSNTTARWGLWMSVSFFFSADGEWSTWFSPPPNVPDVPDAHNFKAFTYAPKPENLLTPPPPPTVWDPPHAAGIGTLDATRFILLQIRQNSCFSLLKASFIKYVDDLPVQI